MKVLFSKERKRAGEFLDFNWFNQNTSIPHSSITKRFQHKIKTSNIN